jgi:hypothetical protein
LETRVISSQSFREELPRWYMIPVRSIGRRERQSAEIAQLCSGVRSLPRCSDVTLGWFRLCWMPRTTHNFELVTVRVAHRDGRSREVQESAAKSKCPCNRQRISGDSGPVGCNKLKCLAALLDLQG